jgi:hypothetical protein
MTVFGSVGSGARDSILPGARYTSYQGYRKVPCCIDFKVILQKTGVTGRIRLSFSLDKRLGG